PKPVAGRLDVLLAALAFTDRPGGFDPPDAGVLLTVADAVRHRRPVSIRYTDRGGRRSERTLHAYGIVAHAGRWYVTGADAQSGEDRTFRLDRISDARALPGSFEAPAGPGPAERLLAGFAAAEYRHEVALRIHGTAEQIRARLPAGVATLEELEEAEEPEEPEAREPAAGRDLPAERWFRVGLRAERLDWLPPLLAALDRPFVIERPAELRDLVTALADRLASYARQV
ncbi:helix-turn-helix transcriptional regulator, partial [Streptomyces sp. NPDC059627]